ncbi:MAG: hypothetical protein ACOYT4_00645 [Nanoarchaeota archaeon]
MTHHRGLKFNFTLKPANIEEAAKELLELYQHIVPGSSLEFESRGDFRDYSICVDNGRRFIFKIEGNMKSRKSQYLIYPYHATFDDFSSLMKLRGIRLC